MSSSITESQIAESQDSNCSRTFDAVDNNSRLWCFAAAEQFTPAQEQVVCEKLAAFVMSWKSHGTPVSGAFEIRYSRFILVAAENTEVSGCSIDSLTREVKAAIESAGVTTADLAMIYYRSGDGIKQVTRDEFAELRASKQVTDETVVIDPTVGRIDAYRSGAWELPLAKSWHVRL